MYSARCPCPVSRVPSVHGAHCPVPGTRCPCSMTAAHCAQYLIPAASFHGSYCLVLSVHGAWCPVSTAQCLAVSAAYPVPSTWCPWLMADACGAWSLHASVFCPIPVAPLCPVPAVNCPMSGAHSVWWSMSSLLLLALSPEIHTGNAVGTKIQMMQVFLLAKIACVKPAKKLNTEIVYNSIYILNTPLHSHFCNCHKRLFTSISGGIETIY